jgi:hypothetical protein
MVTRVVLLGASNLTLSLPTVLGTAASLAGPGPLEFFVAAGHGRCYGRWSRVLVRGLPSILDCGLWPAARGVAPARTLALVTDVGNDIPFGAAPAALAGWIDACLARLGELGADSVLTLLPAATLERLPPWRYHLFKALLFPGRRLPFPIMRQRLTEVNVRLADLAARRGVKVVEPRPGWYRADAIHLGRRQRAAAWQAILSGWETTAHGHPPAAVACRGLAPEWQTLCGLSRRRPQPSGVLPDGTRLSLF